MEKISNISESIFSRHQRGKTAFIATFSRNDASFLKFKGSIFELEYADLKLHIGSESIHLSETRFLGMATHLLMDRRGTKARLSLIVDEFAAVLTFEPVCLSVINIKRNSPILIANVGLQQI